MTTKHHSVPNITRFDYDRTAFQGWRVCKSISGVTYTKYVPDEARRSRADDPAAVSLEKAKTLLRQLGARYRDCSPGGFRAWLDKKGFTISRGKKKEVDHE